jgi:hypothetical protein
MKKKIVIEVDAIFGDKNLNEFMHAVDMFEEGKQLAEYCPLVITANSEVNLENVVENMRKSLDSAGMNVVFVALKSVDGNKSEDIKAFIKPNVQTLSSGKKFGLFKDHLERIGYQVETDKYMHVLSVSI